MKKFVSVMLCLAAAAGASAQQQTVESAQEFLVSVLYGEQADLQRWNLDNKQAPFTRLGKIERVATEQRCLSRIEVRYEPMSYWTQSRGNRVENYYEGGTWKHDLDARLFAEVSVSGEWVKVTSRGGARPVRIKLQSSALAARLGFALDFMRQKCDASASTGF